MSEQNVQDTEDAIGFGGNQDGADPPSILDRLDRIEEQMASLFQMMRQFLDTGVPKPSE